MESKIIEVNNISKKYQLGLTGSGSLYETFAEGTKRLLGRATKKRKEDFWALNDISFSLKRGDILGIVGRNGAGKSTLLKVLSRITPPTKGKITINGRIASLLEVGTGFHPELTGRENIFLNGAILGMSKDEIRKKYDEIVDFSGVEKFLETPVKRYSSGMFVRLAFAVAAHLEPEILVIDEVLAVGDAEFQKKCLGKMDSVAQSGRTILFVSHNMAAVKNLCNLGLYLKSGQLEDIGEINAIVERYLGENKDNTKEFKSGVLKQATVSQIEHEITLSVVYEVLEDDVVNPFLGFVISNSEGVPVTAWGPKMSPDVIYPKKDEVCPKKGTISVTITNPRLADGIYQISIYFGYNGLLKFSEQDCLTIEVIKMGNYFGNFTVKQTGYVEADCKLNYHF